MVTMILWFLNLRHSSTLFGVCVSSPRLNRYSFSSYPLKAKYVKLMGKDKGYNSSHVYCQVKGWSKKSYETFSNNFGKTFENGMMVGQKMDSCKRILKLRCFVLSKCWDSWSFTFPSTFFNTFSLSLSFNAPSLWGLGDFDDKWGDKNS
jgi:hypothetical protein